MFVEWDSFGVLGEIGHIIVSYEINETGLENDSGSNEWNRSLFV